MIFQGEKISFNALLYVLKTPVGFLELVVAVLCVILGYLMAYSVRKWCNLSDVKLEERFFPYIALRLVMPIVVLIFLLLSSWLFEAYFAERAKLLEVVTGLVCGMAVIRICCAILRQALSSKAKLRGNGERILSTILWIAFALWLVGVDSVIIQTLRKTTFTVGSSTFNLLHIITGCIWLAVILVVGMWVSRVLENRIMSLPQLDLSLRTVFAKLVRTVILVFIFLISLPMLGLDLTVLSVFGGALGIGLGFGFQKIASNFISGFIILLERSIRIGDRLMIDNHVGYVSKMTSRYLVLKGTDGTEALIPNDTLISGTVVNQSYTDTNISLQLAVQVAYDTDLEQALALLLQTVNGHPRILITPPPHTFVMEFADSGINLALYFWVADPQNGVLGLKSEINLKIWKSFKAHGIQMPFPQREVRILNEDFHLPDH